MSWLNTTNCSARSPGRLLLRVLFINHLRLGSASTYRQSGLAKYLARLGHTCDFLGLPDPGEGERGREWGAFGSLAFWEEPLVPHSGTNASLLSRAARSHDVIHVNRAYPYTAALATLCRRAEGRLVVDMEDWDGFGGYASFSGKYGPSGFLLTLCEMTFPRLAEEVLVVSGLLRRQAERAGVPPSRITFVPNGFDPELFHEGVDGQDARERLGLGDGPVLMYASTFWPFEMGVHRLVLESFRAALPSLPGAKLLVMGGGDAPVRKMATELGVGEKVVFAGHVPRSQVPGVMAAADVAVHMISGHPYHLASSPMIVPEFMAMGKPVVAPRLGELAAMLGGGAGVLVGGTDPVKMAKAIAATAGDRGMIRSVGRRAAERAIERYSYGSLAKTVAGAYSRA